MDTMQVFVLLVTLTFSPIILAKTQHIRARLMKLSTDKKVFLLNKGKEDGLVEKGHATFHTHEKKVFRAEILQLSPSRSIWQIYKLEDGSVLVENYALEVRSASAVTL